MGDSAEHGGPAFETILSQEEIEYLQLMMPKGFTLVTTPKISSVVSKPSKSGASTSNIKGHGVNGVEPSEHDSNWANSKKIPRAFGKEGKVVTPTTMVPIQPVSMSGNLQTSSTGVTTRPANKQAPVFSELMKKCQTLLKRLQSHNCAAPFLEPVDYKTLNIPDYPLIVKEPMDLGTVEKKLKDGLYANPAAFGADVRKIWANAFLYNPKTHQIWDMTKRMQDFFEKNFKEVEDSPLADGNLATFVDTKLSAANKKIDTLKTKGAHSESEQQLKPMTTEEKFNLALHIRNLPGVMLEGIREILIEDTPSFKDKTTIEFDLSKLPTVVLRKLEKHCKSKNGSFTNQLPQKPGKSQDGSEGVSVIRPEGEPTQRNMGSSSGHKPPATRGAVPAHDDNDGDDDNDHGSATSSFLSQDNGSDEENR